MAKVYTPLSNKAPLVFAGLTLLAGYVVGPAIGWALFRYNARICDEIFAELPHVD